MEIPGNLTDQAACEIFCKRHDVETGTQDSVGADLSSCPLRTAASEMRPYEPGIYATRIRYVNCDYAAPAQLYRGNLSHFHRLGWRIHVSSGNSDYRVCIFRTADGVQLGRALSHPGRDHAIFASDGRRLITVGHNQIRIWDLSTTPPKVEVRGQPGVEWVQTGRKAGRASRPPDPTQGRESAEPLSDLSEAIRQSSLIQGLLQVAGSSPENKRSVDQFVKPGKVARVVKSSSTLPDQR